MKTISKIKVCFLCILLSLSFSCCINKSDKEAFVSEINEYAEKNNLSDVRIDSVLRIDTFKLNALVDTTKLLDFLQHIVTIKLDLNEDDEAFMEFCDNNMNGNEDMVHAINEYIRHTHDILKDADKYNYNEIFNFTITNSLNVDFNKNAIFAKCRKTNKDIVIIEKTYNNDNDSVNYKFISPDNLQQSDVYRCSKINRAMRAVEEDYSKINTRIFIRNRIKLRIELGEHAWRF